MRQEEEGGCLRKITVRWFSGWDVNRGGRGAVEMLLFFNVDIVFVDSLWLIFT